MQCLPRCLPLLLSLAAVASTAAVAGSPRARAGAVASPRVIVRFADPRGKATAAEFLRGKVRELGARPGVRQVKGLMHVGMAVAACESQEAVEQLVQELEEDPTVELATPDTWVRFDGAPRGSTWGSAERPLQDLRRCSAQSGCAAQGLVGDCCPAWDGAMLACCDAPATENLVAFRSFHGKYVVAEESGAANANRDELDDWEKFQLFYNDDGTVSLRSFFSRYVSAEEHGGVNANRDLIGDWEKFQLIHNSDSTVSLKTFHGKYFVAEKDGSLNANREKIDDWEKFVMISAGGSSQRFPNDANFTALWGMHHYDDEDIDAPEAWKKFTGEFSAGIVVAVIDTGIDYTHEDLGENMWVNPGEIPGNGEDDDGNGFVDDVHGADFANEDGDPMDDQMHGTHCAGTIAGVGNNGLGVTGVAWRGVRLMALKFLDASGSGKTSDAVQAIDYAVAHGARIASNSWGGGSSSAAARIAIERAEAAGILFVAAAGNAGTDNDEEPHYPSNYPAAGIVSVASTTSAGELSGFSCYGAATVDLAAPGSRIYSTVPGQAYQSLSGTSMATPHVSGLAALVWMYRPALSMTQVKEILMSSVVHSEALQGKVFSGGRINARKALEAASAVEPPHPPLHAPRAVAFKDVEPKIGIVGGIVNITAANDESDVDYYKVYWVSQAGFQLDAIGKVKATGARLLEVKVAGVAMPQFAAGLVAVAGNATGEMPAQIGGIAPSIAVVDFGTPEMGPKAAAWKGDIDLRSGIVAGALSITRAADEKSITQYNVYWSNVRGSRGPFLGSIPAVGFMEPKCTGPACSLINATSSAGRHQYDRLDYQDGEEATILASGPGSIKVTRFDTEEYYDTLSVGDNKLSGQPSVPLELDLPAGPVALHWFSDESLTATGWTFELVQTDTTADFWLPASAPLGRGLEVVPEFRGTELPEGLFVEVVDYNSSMPPSPGFAPAAVRFEDLDTAAGVIAGAAVILPSQVAAANGSVTYYQLDFADADGAVVSLGGRADANGSCPVVIPIATMPPPAGASKLIARAGNAFGLGAGRACADLLDADAIPPPNTSNVSRPNTSGRDERRLQAQAKSGDSSIAKAARPRHTSEPWLQQPHMGEKKEVIWPSGAAPFLSASAAPQSRILGAISVPGLDAHAAVEPEVRSAFEGALAAGLPHVAEGRVEVGRISAMRQAAAMADPTRNKEHDAAMIEFEVEPAPGTPANALDRIESRLILLSMGGASSKLFNDALLTRLAEAGAILPAGTRVQVREPQQVFAKRRAGRALAAAAADPLGEEVELNSSASLQDDEVEAIFDAVVLASLAALLAAAAALASARRGSKSAAERSGGTAVLESIRVLLDAKEALPTR